MHVAYRLILNSFSLKSIDYEQSFNVMTCIFIFEVLETSNGNFHMLTFSDSACQLWFVLMHLYDSFVFA